MADTHSPAHGKPHALAIYAHGINGFKDWGGMDLIARKFASNGIAFLKFNFSHNGTTPEKPEEFADTEAYGNDNYLIRQQDLKVVIDFALSTEEWRHLPLYLIGHSRGGTDVILYANSDNRVSGIITWAAVAEARTPWRNWQTEELSQWKETGVRFLRNSRTGQELPVYYQLYEEYQANKQKLDVEMHARNISKPWLIIHGTADESVFVKDAYSLKEWCPDANVFVIPETGHTFDRVHPWDSPELPSASEALATRTIEFISEAE